MSDQFGPPDQIDGTPFHPGNSPGAYRFMVRATRSSDVVVPDPSLALNASLTGDRLDGTPRHPGRGPGWLQQGIHATYGDTGIVPNPAPAAPYDATGSRIDGGVLHPGRGVGLWRFLAHATYGSTELINPIIESVVDAATAAEAIAVLSQIALADTAQGTDLGAVTFVAGASQLTAAASIALSVPAGTQDGDVMVAILTDWGGGIACGASPVLTPPAGWTLLGSDSACSGGTAQGTWIYRRVASVEPASYTWAIDAGVLVAAVAAYRGVDNTNPVDIAAVEASGANGSPQSPSVVTASPNDMVLSLIGVSSPTYVSGPSAPNNMSSRDAGGLGSLPQMQVAIAHAAVVVPGTFAPNAWLATQDPNWQAWTLALRAAPGLAVTQLVAAADSAAAADALAVLGLIAASDAASAADALAVLSSIAASDSGSASDALAVLGKLALAESAAGAESLAVLGSIASTDTASGADALSVLGLVAASDSGNGAEALSLLAGVAASDVGAAGEAISVLGGVAASDAAAAADATSVLASLVAADSGHAQEALGQLMLIATDDGGSGSDAEGVIVLLALGESAGVVERLGVVVVGGVPRIAGGGGSAAVLARIRRERLRRVRAERQALAMLGLPSREDDPFGMLLDHADERWN